MADSFTVGDAVVFPDSGVVVTRAQLRAGLAIYMSDYGPVMLGPKAEALPRRKNGQFDMRFAVSRAFIGALKSEAERVYTSHRRKTLEYFNG